VSVLVDTHALLWWLFDPSRLSPTARGILEDAASPKLVSMATLWELAIKISTGKLGWSQVTVRDIAGQLIEQEFTLLPVRVEELSRVESMERLHRDPFDRLLIAQAWKLGVPLLTQDRMIRRYPVRTIW
jgi:PIN domain nuclease of toxin-antitoxin system